jgi:hypothetical protein
MMISTRTLRHLTVVSLLAVVAVVSPAHRAAANAPPGRYLIPGDGTVYDTKTKLTWQQSIGPNATPTDAMAYCAANTAGLPGGPWRLPNIKELQTLVDENQPYPAVFIDPVAFPGLSLAADNVQYISSTLVNSPIIAWALSFTGADTWHSTEDRVRCVR